MTNFILQTGTGLIKLLALVFAIVMPLLILLEIIRHYGLLQKMVRYVSPVTRRLGFQDDSVFPLIAGIFFGLTYGAGVLLGEAKKGRIVGNQAFLVAIYLALCHAIIEDTLLFTTQGAVWWILIGVRVLVASAVSATMALWLNKRTASE